MKVVTLIENSPGDRKDLLHEHGLSFWIEREGKAIVFDTGAGSAFLHNANKLMIDTQRAESLLISHAHYDHAGGVRAFYEKNGNSIPLITGDGFFDPKFKSHAWGRNYIGIDFDLQWIQKMKIQHHTLKSADGSTEIRELIPGIWAVCAYPRIMAEEKCDPCFMVERNGSSVPEIDDFRDEVCVAAEINNSLVIITACSHPGIINMLEAIKNKFKKEISAILGGVHLLNADNTRINKFLKYINSPEIICTGLCHCSGEAIVSRLKRNDKRYYSNAVGCSFYW